MLLLPNRNEKYLEKLYVQSENIFQFKWLKSLYQAKIIMINLGLTFFLII